MDHRLDRVGFFADALEVRVAEPHATANPGAIFILILSSTHRSQLADEEVRVVHKLLVTGPDRPLAFSAAFHRSLFFDIEEVDLVHTWKVNHVFRTYRYPGAFLILSTYLP